MACHGLSLRSLVAFEKEKNLRWTKPWSFEQRLGMTRVLDPEYENVRNYWAAIKLLRLLRLCMFLLDYLGSGVCHSDIGHKLTCTHLQTPSPFVPHKSRDRYNMCINILQDSIAINYHYTIYMHSYICRIVYIDIHTNSLYIDAYVLALSLLCSKY